MCGIAGLIDPDRTVTGEQGPASRQNHGMIVDDQYPCRRFLAILHYFPASVSYT